MIQELPVTATDQTFTFRAASPARYRLQLMRGAVIVALTSPIYLQRSTAPLPPRLPVIPRS